MRTHLSIIIFFALIWAGCSTVNYIPEDSRDPRFELAKKDLGGKSGKLKPVYGRELDVSNLELSNASLHYSSQEDSQRFGLSFSALYKVTLARPTSGLVVGMARGLLGGVAIASGLSAASLYMAFAPNEEVNRAVAWGAGVGLVIGAIYGAYNPSTDIYYFGGADQFDPPDPGSPSWRPAVQLHMTTLSGETEHAVRIVWNGHDLWLKKSDIKIERRDDGIWLTIPGQLLE